jgi:hypothetical protein
MSLERKKVMKKQRRSKEKEIEWGNHYEFIGVSKWFGSFIGAASPGI